jgi:hypothetical protein
MTKNNYTEHEEQCAKIVDQLLPVIVRQLGFASPALRHDLVVQLAKLTDGNMRSKDDDPVRVVLGSIINAVDDMSSSMPDGYDGSEDEEEGWYGSFGTGYDDDGDTYVRWTRMAALIARARELL